MSLWQALNRYMIPARSAAFIFRVWIKNLCFFHRSGSSIWGNYCFLQLVQLEAFSRLFSSSVTNTEVTLYPLSPGLSVHRHARGKFYDSKVWWVGRWSSQSTCALTAATALHSFYWETRGNGKRTNGFGRNAVNPSWWDMFYYYLQTIRLTLTLTRNRRKGPGWILYRQSPNRYRPSVLPLNLIAQYCRPTVTEVHSHWVTESQSYRIHSHWGLKEIPGVVIIIIIIINNFHYHYHYHYHYYYHYYYYYYYYYFKGFSTCYPTDNTARQPSKLNLPKSCESEARRRYVL